MTRVLTWWRSLPTWARVLLLVAAVGLAVAVAGRVWEAVCAALLALAGFATGRPAGGRATGPAPHQVAATAAGESRRAADRVEDTATALRELRADQIANDLEVNRSMAAAAESGRAEAEAREPTAPAPTSTFLDRLRRRPGGAP